VFFLYGSGRNGKSVVTSVIDMLIGKSNISHVSLTAFQRNRFSGAELYGKFCNTCNELDYEDLTKTDVLKQLSGGDSIQAERKFQHPFNFVNYAKLIFVTNELPRTTDKTNAFFRRVFLIHFANIFEEDKEDKLLLDRITTEEIEGLAFKCLGYLRGIGKRGFAFGNDEAPQVMMKNYERDSNPFETFVEEHYEEDPDGYVPKSEFKEHYKAWVTNKGFRIPNDKVIKEAMKTMGVIEEKRTLVGKARANCWVGLKTRKQG
jgi:putative DNA primase/helicase